MTIKSLLLGSAAAMLAVSGANAADAVFAAEPEPMEYVKVCDTYGNGFFYIPGTETCLNINGYIRTEYIYTDNNIVETGDWRYRARLNIDARNETDWGTLRSQLRIQGDGRATDANAVIDRALISIGGLRMGYSDLFFNTNHGYGWQRAANDGYYDFDQGILLDYTFAGNGFSATIGVQDTASVGPVLTSSDPIDVYAGVSYSGSWGRVAGSVIYDTSADEMAWKVSANITAIENLVINAWYQADNGGTPYVTGYLAPTVEWEWGVDVAYQVNAQFAVWAGYTDADFTDAERFGIGAIWNPVSGLSIRPEAVFGGGGNYTQVRLRVVRSF